MADSAHPPLNYEASATTTHPQTSSSLPPEVAQCLKNARFLHLATISSKPAGAGQPTPQVSLMNYTFLPNYRDEGPVIIMTTNARSLKTENLLHNPNVSILVHDWVSHRPPTASPVSVSGQRSGSPPAVAAQSSLAALLLNLNTSALSSISTTIAGVARFLDAGSDEEKWCKEAHLANNTFGDSERDQSGGQVRMEASVFRRQQQQQQHQSSTGTTGTTGTTAAGYIAGDDVRVVLVPVREGRIADWKGGVKDWVLDLDASPDQAQAQAPAPGQGSAPAGDVGNRGRAGGSNDQNLTNGIIN